MYKAIKVIAQERRWLLVLLLITSFALSFSIPLFFSKVIWHASSIAPTLPKKQTKGYISSYRPILGSNKKVQIFSPNNLSPEKGKDFLLISWVKLGRLLQESEQLVFLGKYNKEAKTRPGYAIALRKRGEQIHPLVYWNDENDKGRWFSFSALEGVEKSWVMFALSFTENQFLGLHAVTTSSEHAVTTNSEDDSENKISLLGGYKLEESIIPSNNETLYLGSIGDSFFKGRFGPIAIISKTNLSEDINLILESFSESPEELPKQVSLESTKLWSSDLKTDKSQFEAKINLNKSK